MSRHSAPSVPRPVTTTWLPPIETAPGPDVNWPPNDRQSLQLKPPHRRCHIAPSRPTANTSSTLAAGDAASGPLLRPPPRVYQPTQWSTTQALAHSALSP